MIMNLFINGVTMEGVNVIHASIQATADGDVVHVAIMNAGHITTKPMSPADAKEFKDHIDALLASEKPHE